MFLGKRDKYLLLQISGGIVVVESSIRVWLKGEIEKEWGKVCQKTKASRREREELVTRPKRQRGGRRKTGKDIWKKKISKAAGLPPLKSQDESGGPETWTQSQYIDSTSSKDGHGRRDERKNRRVRRNAGIAVTNYSKGGS